MLLTTHYMDEAQQLADRVAVIAAGRIIAEGTPDTLGGRGQAASRDPLRRHRGASAAARSARPPVIATVTTWSCSTPRPGRLCCHSLTGWAIEHGVPLEGLEVTRPSLEETYLELIAGQDAAQGKAGHDALARHHLASCPLHRPVLLAQSQRGLFGIAFPLMILAINSAVFGGGNGTRMHGEAATVASAFYVASMSVFRRRHDLLHQPRHLDRSMIATWGG